jgi:hypothetical protein
MKTSLHGIDQVLKKHLESLPALSRKDVITYFAGNSSGYMERRLCY